MNAAEGNVFLTKAAQLDPRMKRVVAEDQADLAEMWAAALPDVSLADALSAIPAHYRESRDPMMPADVLRRVEVSVPVLSSRDAWLLSQNVDPAEYDAAIAAGGSPRAVLAGMGVTVAEIES